MARLCGWPGREDEVPDRSDSDSHGASFERVLDAEKRADIEIARARENAARLLRSARAEERAIAARADRRLQALHADIHAAIERERGRMRRAFANERRALSAPPDPDLICAAAARVARAIAGIDSS